MVSSLCASGHIAGVIKPSLYGRALVVSRRWAAKVSLTAMAIGDEAAEAARSRSGGAWENQRYYYAFGWYGIIIQNSHSRTLRSIFCHYIPVAVASSCIASGGLQRESNKVDTKVCTVYVFLV